MPKKKKQYIKSLLNKEVVIDTDSSMCYIGKLVDISDDVWVIQDADIYDRNEGLSSKEKYINDIRKHGIRPSRKEVYISTKRILSCSALDSIIVY